MANLPVRSGGRSTAVINPSREFEDIYDRMGELMNLAFGLAPVQLADAAWTPLADLSETDDAYIVKVDLPGARKDQVQVQVQDRQLTVTGEIPESQDGDGERSHRRSRRTGRFELHTYLPGEVNTDAVRAELADGVLTVTVPKAEASKPHKVEITG
jgi:HSP20 family protein